MGTAKAPKSAACGMMLEDDDREVVVHSGSGLLDDDGCRTEAAVGKICTAHESPTTAV